ncbi:proteasome subunit protein [Helicosporidium sp. ATCC 50920]|nr:proteasome subunit protein [Helicosporidium sp. ATCC 50920]|eukprot:KDD75697.1 proteasome subunit protein [Helicosporidium sp. ATCC 50920]
MSRYDRAITVFSPDGHLFQVEYALEAVRKGALAVAIRGTDAVILAVEKKAAAKLQVRQTIRKIAQIDERLCLVFAGLTADARVLINKARIEAASHRLTLDEPAGVDYITRYIAALQQHYTQSGGVRPFGISTLVAGFEPGSNAPALYQTDPSGTYSAWKAAAVGHNSKAVREYLEKHWTPQTSKGALMLALKALGEVMDASVANVEIAILTADNGLQYMPDEQLAAHLAEIEEEKAQAGASARRTTGTEAS